MDPFLPSCACWFIGMRSGCVRDAFLVGAASSLHALRWFDAGTRQLLRLLTYIQHAQFSQGFREFPLPL